MEGWNQQINGHRNQTDGFKITSNSWTEDMTRYGGTTNLLMIKSTRPVPGTAEWGQDSYIMEEGRLEHVLPLGRVASKETESA